MRLTLQALSLLCLTDFRNGYTGEVVQLQSSGGDKRGPIRARRTRLQSGLLQEVPSGLIQFGKKLLTIQDRGFDGVRLFFEDGSQAFADLVVGADGIRSVSYTHTAWLCLYRLTILFQVVRRILYPDLRTKFTGKSISFLNACSVCLTYFWIPGNTAWRVLVPKSSLAHIPDITQGTSWWYGKSGHAYFSGVDDASDLRPGAEELFELSVRSYREPDIPGTTVSWGVSASNEKVKSRFSVCKSLSDQ